MHRATVCKVAAQAQLIAVGTAMGSVHLLRLNPLAPAAAAAMADADVALVDPSTYHSLADDSQQLVHDKTAAAAVASSPSVATNGQASAAVRHGMPGLQQHQQGSAGFNSGIHPNQLVRTLELQDWGHTPQQTGGVSDLAWAPDCRALAVGFRRQGLVVWTPSGCRLLCTLRQPAPEATGAKRTDSASSTADAAVAYGSGSSTGSTDAGQQRRRQPAINVDGGVSGLAWGAGGYQLMVAGMATDSSTGPVSSSSSSNSTVYELSLAKSLHHHHRVTHVSATAAGSTGPVVAQLSEELHVMQVIQ
jgi:hypothetical protein